MFKVIHCYGSSLEVRLNEAAEMGWTQIVSMAATNHYVTVILRKNYDPR